MMSRMGFEPGPNERIVINGSPSQASPYTGESPHPCERDTKDFDSPRETRRRTGAFVSGPAAGSGVQAVKHTRKIPNRDSGFV